MQMKISLGSLAMRAHVAAALASLAMAPIAAQAQAYARVTGNDMSQCRSGGGPAVRVAISGLKSDSGNLFVRIYYAKRSDWLKSKRYLTRVDASPRAGTMTVCVPIDGAGTYAIAVQHDVNGNRETDFSTDGAGMSNNPKIGSFLGIPRPPSVDKASFRAGTGVTNVRISMRYPD